jgi:hypothetical protein
MSLYVGSTTSRVLKSFLSTKLYVGISLLSDTRVMVCACGCNGSSSSSAIFKSLGFCFFSMSLSFIASAISRTALQRYGAIL